MASRLVISEQCLSDSNLVSLLSGYCMPAYSSLVETYTIMDSVEINKTTNCGTKAADVLKIVLAGKL